MGFVADDEIWRRVTMESSDERSHAGDLNTFIPFVLVVRADTAVMDPHSVKRSRDLLDQLGPMNEDNNSLALPSVHTGKMAEDNSLPSACR